jgi:hypothetical protein
MLRFRRVLNYLEVKELELVGRHFTWSNNQSTPTMTHIDRVFCTPAWEDLYPNPILQPLPSSTSDHCPILVVPLITPYIKPKFRFESYWAQMPGFRECVQEAWSKGTPPNQNPFGVLHIKLSRTAKALRKWSRTLIPQGKMALAVCREVIEQLEKTQESRMITPQERALIKHLKHRILGLPAICKSRARQRSRLTWLQVMPILNISTRWPMQGRRRIYSFIID